MLIKMISKKKFELFLVYIFVLDFSYYCEKFGIFYLIYKCIFLDIC